MTFQGGFVGRTCAVHVRLAKLEQEKEKERTRTEWTLLTYVYPEDVNRRQIFTLPTLHTTSTDTTDIAERVSAIRLTFETSSDFFGRVTVYDLKLEGYR
ncbi:hypothetical protein BDP27DRAFT_1313540 [Rhodocollybia butyracea]|uniref:Uncharacterized protein n=1 Tax=Rhodocollybia butyracea TaxID=206335 RepID=A0A9P5Q8F1_9AGAR|nr:hypothetical protein BDP27DRAFT_1313540 [Rhodocollybia butyracea]